MHVCINMDHESNTPLGNWPGFSCGTLIHSDPRSEWTCKTEISLLLMDRTQSAAECKCWASKSKEGNQANQVRGCFLFSLSLKYFPNKTGAEKTGKGRGNQLWLSANSTPVKSGGGWGFTSHWSAYTGPGTVEPISAYTGGKIIGMSQRDSVPSWTGALSSTTQSCPTDPLQAAGGFRLQLSCLNEV